MTHTELIALRSSVRVHEQRWPYFQNKAADNCKTNRVGWRAPLPVNSRLGSRLREVSAFPKPWSSHLTRPSLHFPPLSRTYRKGRALALNSSGCSTAKLPEQERKERLSSFAQSSKRFLNSPMLTLTRTAEAHQLHGYFSALTFIQNTIAQGMLSLAQLNLSRCLIRAALAHCWYLSSAGQ